MKKNGGTRVAANYDKLPPKKQAGMGQRTKEIAGQFGAKARSAASASDLATIRSNAAMAAETGESVKRRRR